MAEDKIKIKTIYDDIIERFGIEEPKNGIRLKPLPKEWVWESIKNLIEIIEPKYINKRLNDEEFVMQINFKTEKEAKEFDSTMNSKIISNINKYITDKNENYKDYRRNFVTSTEVKGSSLMVRI